MDSNERAHELLKWQALAPLSEFDESYPYAKVWHEHSDAALDAWDKQHPYGPVRAGCISQVRTPWRVQPIRFLFTLQGQRCFTSSDSVATQRIKTKEWHDLLRQEAQEIIQSHPDDQWMLPLRSAAELELDLDVKDAELH